MAKKKTLDPMADVQQEALLSMIDGDQAQEVELIVTAPEKKPAQVIEVVTTTKDGDDANSGSDGERVTKTDSQRKGWIRTSIALRSDVHEALHKIAFVNGTTANALILEQINNLIAESKDDLAFYESLPGARRNAKLKKE